MSNESKCFIHSHWHNAFFFLDESLFLLSSIKKVKREAPNPFSYFVRFEDFCQARCSALQKAKQHKSELTYTYMRDRTGKNSWLPLLFFFFFYIHAPANIFVEHLKWWEEEKVPWHLLFGKSFAVFFFFSCLLVEITPCLLSPILYIYFSFFFIGLHVLDQ